LIEQQVTKQMESEKSLIQTIDALKAQKRECEDTLKRRCEELDEANQQNITLQQLYQKENANVRKSEDRAAKLIELIKSLEEKIRVHQEKESKLKASERNLQQSYDILQNKINELMEQQEQCNKMAANAADDEHIIENLQNQLEEYKKSISLKCAELAQLFKNNEELNAIKCEYEIKMQQMVQQSNSNKNRQNELNLMMKQRDEMKAHYMTLNEKYAAVLLELNEMKINGINNENVEQPSEADLYSSMLQSGNTDQDEEPFELENFMNLVSDLNDSNAKQYEEENEVESEEQKELNEYLKRVESMHGQFDHNLSYIKHAKNESQSDDSESETNSEDLSLLH